MSNITLTISNSDVTIFIDGVMHKNSNVDKKDIDELKKLIVEHNSCKQEMQDTPNEHHFDRKFEDMTEIEKKIVSIIKPHVTQKEKEKEIEDLESKVDYIENEEKYKDVLASKYPDVFTVKDGNVFLKGFESVVMPDNLVTKIIQSIDSSEDIESFVNFWKLTLMNPNPKSREGLFKYVQKQNLLITKRGYLVCYRKANKVSENGKDVLNNDGVPILTDNHSKTMRFSLGEVVKQNRSKCNENPNVECSYGLHVGTPSYIKSNEWAGQVYMLVFVNPMHVVSVPYRDAHKMRVCEYYISSVLTSLEEIINIDGSDKNVFLDEYCDYEMNEFEEYLKEKKFDFEQYDSLNKNEKEKFKMKLNELRNDIRISDDFISKDLSIEEIQRIIKSRIN